MPFLGQANATQNPLEQLDNIHRKLTVQNKENILTHIPYTVYLQSEMYTFRMVSSMSVQWCDSKWTTLENACFFCTKKNNTYTSIYIYINYKLYINWLFRVPFAYHSMPSIPPHLTTSLCSALHVPLAPFQRGHRSLPHGTTSGKLKALKGGPTSLEFTCCPRDVNEFFCWHEFLHVSCLMSF